MATVSSTFYLKNPKSKKDTLIYFACYFKHEEKRFVYSTGEKIHPSNWDQKNRQPITHGKHRSKLAPSIRMQINRYKDKFEEIQARCKTFNEDFTSKTLRDEFDKEFKRTVTGKRIFFSAFDEFMSHKTKNQEWSPNTIKRYRTVKNILLSFEESRNYKLTFNAINSKFHVEFTDYCISEKGHINNTYSRNLGFFKSFMFWALENGYTYKEDFKKFKKKERVASAQVALTEKDLETIMKQKFETKRLEKVRDVFVFACVTGMRFGELRLIGKENVYGGNIHLKEEKDSDKASRTIPLNDLSIFILRKYNHQLPIIANQKQNLYIKEVFRLAGYTHEIEKTSTRGKEVIREKIPFCDRISTHTARRTFITLMKRKLISDKLIASITGHKDMKTLHQYYQVDDDAKSQAVKDVFKIDFSPLEKAN